MKPTAIELLSEDAWQQLVTNERIPCHRFCLEMDPTELARRLYVLYKEEVERVQNNFQYSEALGSLLKECASWLSNPRGKTGLLLAGLFGNGKTTMMTAVARLIATAARLEGLEHWREYSPVVRLAPDIALLGTTPEGLKELNGLNRVRLLCIDDMGMEPFEVHSYGVKNRPMERLLMGRYVSRGLTIVTTNLNPEELQIMYQDRAYDRMREMFQLVIFEGDSYRTY
ncbi:MAG: hypothetical protein K2F74_00845 [Muribaculaceae bacterium]|nr:hypothetical protein [Muribaculaceae bacterium]